MKANYWNKEKDLRIIRPLVYVRETETRKFAEGNKLPIIPENCPACFSEPKERNRMKQLLAQQEILHPNIFHSLRKEFIKKSVRVSNRKFSFRTESSPEVVRAVDTYRF